MKVVEFLSRKMEELSPFVWIILIQLHLASLILYLGIFVGFRRRWAVDELEHLTQLDQPGTHQWSSGDNTRSSREKVSTDYILQD